MSVPPGSGCADTSPCAKHTLDHARAPSGHRLAGRRVDPDCAPLALHPGYARYGVLTHVFEALEMGIVSGIRQKYRNAGANVTLFFYVVDSLDRRENVPEAEFVYMCTGLELHNYAREAKKSLLRALNENPAARHSIRIPDDYWKLSIRHLIGDYNANGHQIPCNTLVRDLVCLIIDVAFQDFHDGDLISVYFLKGGDVSLEIVRKKPSVELIQRRLGNVNFSC